MDELRKRLREKYPNHIANEYSETKELSLAKFDGHDMCDFAEQYANEKAKVTTDNSKVNENLLKRVKELEELTFLDIMDYYYDDNNNVDCDEQIRGHVRKIINTLKS